MSWFRPTIRLRLTLLFGGLFIAAGAILIVLTYGLLGLSLQPLVLPDPDEAVEQPGEQEGDVQGSLAEQIFEARTEERAEALNEVLTQSLIAFFVTSAGAIVLGWIVAGRVLSPIRHITAHARRASEATLGERIGLRGPPDELKELADTMDAMLARLETAFATQRWFAAQASHELRTPLAVIRAETDVALAAPDVTDRELRLAEAIRTAADRSERLIDGLLALARSESTLRDDVRVDLAELVGDVVGEHARAADGAGISLDLTLDSATVFGDRSLLERLVGNLVENAIQHNFRGGWAWVSVATLDGETVLQVANSGPMLDPSTLIEIFEPFRRGTSGAARQPGFGLGLAIVRSVVATHSGSIETVAPASGGLLVVVRLPSAIAPSTTRP